MGFNKYKKEITNYLNEQIITIRNNNKRRVNMRYRTITIMFLLLLLTPILVYSAEIITDIDIKNVVIQENRQTRAEIKKYFDTKADKLLEVIKQDAQKLLNENFAAFDNMVHKLATEMLIRLVIGLITAILLSHIIWYLIKSQIEKIKSRKRKPT